MIRAALALTFVCAILLVGFFLHDEPDIVGAVPQLPAQAHTIAGERVEMRQRGNVVEVVAPWKGERGITIQKDLGTPSQSELSRGKRNIEVITEVLDDGFKVDFLLNEKPNTNVFCQTVEGHENYDWFYQPELTPEEIADGASRPENVVGSYAVYHKTLKNHKVPKIDKTSYTQEELNQMVLDKKIFGKVNKETKEVEYFDLLAHPNYQTGKAFHVYRPQVWEVNDKENTTEWAELSFNNGQLCVTVDQNYLNTATYPVRVDPTFGYTSDGGSTTSIASARESTLVLTSRRKGNGFNLAENGTLDSITAFLKKDTDVAGTYTIDLSAFINREDSAGSGSHGEVVHIERTSVAISNTTYQEYTFTAASESLVADDYVLNVLGDANDLPYSGEGTTVLDIDLAFDTNATPDLNSYETFSSDTDGTSYTDERNEDPWVDVAFFSNNKFSIYATYSLATSETATTPATNFTGSSVIESVIIQ